MSEQTQEDIEMALALAMSAASIDDDDELNRVLAISRQSEEFVERLLRKLGTTKNNILGDGNCLYAAALVCIQQMIGIFPTLNSGTRRFLVDYGIPVPESPTPQHILRLIVADAILTTPRYQEFVGDKDDGWEAFANAQATPGVWGNELCIRILCDILGLSIQVYSADGTNTKYPREGLSHYCVIIHTNGNHFDVANGGPFESDESKAAAATQALIAELVAEEERHQQDNAASEAFIQTLIASGEIQSG